VNLSQPPARRLPIGAEVLKTGGVHFRVWAPRCKKIVAVIEASARRDASVELANENNGYFSGIDRDARRGDLYRFCLDTHEKPLPDPASRFQPEGPFGPSMIIDPDEFTWQDSHWPGVRLEGQVIYEMHIGTFSRGGTWEAASEQLPSLKELGVTALEIMPVHDFSGNYGWGYDGVDFFAPTRLYGTPNDFRAFVDRAHVVGLGVILDVVYNHAGPAGNYLKDFSPNYFTDRYATEWGEPFNFDGADSGPVREFFLANAAYWIDEFHLDGLRLDATQNIYDASETHILAEIVERVRRAAGARSTVVIGENEPQNVQLLRPAAQGGYGLDALWSDDFHHSAMVALTGHKEAYYSDYNGKPQEFISAAKRGFLYQGQYYVWQQARRGTSTQELKPAAFVHYIQNHDQIANVGRGLRVHEMTAPGLYRAMTALLLLSPQTPLLFQGQEFAATAPFAFFADHDPELARKVKEGRLEFLSQFPSLGSRRMRRLLPDPSDPEVFHSCRLDFSERESHRPVCDLHRDLLKLRREDPVIKESQRPGAVDGAVLSNELFAIRFFAPEPTDDRLLLVNLGTDAELSPVPEPLLAPPVKREWRILWSSEDPLYDGGGGSPVETAERWNIPGRAAFILVPWFNGNHRSESAHP
jgi:maltooligosyltrehalose trehalohydrolase